MILLHGTTKQRAASIVANGPDPTYEEPESSQQAGGFSMCVSIGPFPFGHPEEYAKGKARLFPDEGEPVVLEIDVPDDIVKLATSAYFPLNQGLVQFDPGAGLDELKTSWHTIATSARIRSLT